MSHAALIKRAIPAYFLLNTPERRDAIIGEKINISPLQGFIYLKNGSSALDVNKIVRSERRSVSDSNIPAAVEAGRNSFEIRSTSAHAEDEFAGGVMMVFGGPGNGTRIPISSNGAVVANANISVTLQEELPVALTTSSDVLLLADIHRDVAEGDAGNYLPFGTTIAEVPANYYFWAAYGATQGIANAAITANDGSPIIMAADGNFAIQGTDLRAVVGHTLVGGDIGADDVWGIWVNQPGL